MSPYQVLLVDRSNYTFAIEQIVENDDATAIVKAREIRVPSFGATFEIWQGERFVYGAACDDRQREAAGLSARSIGN